MAAPSLKKNPTPASVKPTVLGGGGGGGADKIKGPMSQLIHALVVKL